MFSWFPMAQRHVFPWFHTERAPGQEIFWVIKIAVSVVSRRSQWWTPVARCRVVGTGFYGPHFSWFDEWRKLVCFSKRTTHQWPDLHWDGLGPESLEFCQERILFLCSDGVWDAWTWVSKPLDGMGCCGATFFSGEPLLYPAVVKHGNENLPIYGWFSH